MANETERWHVSFGGRQGSVYYGEQEDNCRICVLAKELQSERERAEALTAALEELMAWQNGPPLHTYEKGWTEAMDNAHAALNPGAQRQESRTMKDALITMSETHFEWRDRLLILFGWNVHHYVRTATENVIGKTTTEVTRVNLSRPRWMPERKLQGYAEVGHD